MKYNIIAIEKEIAELKSDISRRGGGDLPGKRERIKKLEDSLKEWQRRLSVGLREYGGNARLSFNQKVPKAQDKLKTETEALKNRVDNNVNQYINEVLKVIQYCENEIRSNTKNIR